MVNPTNPTAPPDPTQLSVGDYTSSIILNRIFELILSMLTALQNAGAAQANRLTFFSGWQTAYTNLASQVPTFSSGSGPFGSGSASTQLTQMNQLNSNLTSTVQNRQSVVSDDAKALQSNVNQTNDAVNSQTDLGTAILQELGTLLSTIFK